MANDAAIPAERIALYDRLIAGQPGLERKGATLPYTSLNGHMTSFLTPSGSLALRLPKGDRDGFLEQFATQLHEAHGTVMKEYVSIPDDLFADTDRLRPFFAATARTSRPSSPSPRPAARGRHSAAADPSGVPARWPPHERSPGHGPRRTPHSPGNSRDARRHAAEGVHSQRVITDAPPTRLAPGECSPDGHVAGNAPTLGTERRPTRRGRIGHRCGERIQTSPSTTLTTRSSAGIETWNSSSRTRSMTLPSVGSCGNVRNSVTRYLPSSSRRMPIRA